MRDFNLSRINFITADYNFKSDLWFVGKELILSTRYFRDGILAFFFKMSLYSGSDF